MHEKIDKLFVKGIL